MRRKDVLKDELLRRHPHYAEWRGSLTDLIGDLLEILGEEEAHDAGSSAPPLPKIVHDSVILDVGHRPGGAHPVVSLANRYCLREDHHAEGIDVPCSIEDARRLGAHLYKAARITVEVLAEEPPGEEPTL